MPPQVCPQCKKLTQGTRSCTHCKASLQTSGLPEVSAPPQFTPPQENEIEIARLVAEAELQGWIDQQLIVPGDRVCLLFRDGVLKERLDPGRNSVKGLWDRWAELLQPQDVAVLMIQPGDFVLPVALTDLITKSVERWSGYLNLVIRIGGSAECAARLLRTVHRHNGRLPLSTLNEPLGAAIDGAVRRVLLDCTSGELTQLHPELQGRLSEAISENITPLLSALGLELQQVSGWEFTNMSYQPLLAEAEKCQTRLSLDRLESQFQQRCREQKLQWQRLETAWQREDFRTRLDAARNQHEFDAEIRKLETEVQLDSTLQQQTLDRAWKESERNKAGQEHALAVLRHAHTAELGRLDFEMQLQRVAFDSQLNGLQLKQELDSLEQRHASKLRMSWDELQLGLRTQEAEREQKVKDHELEQRELQSAVEAYKDLQQFKQGQQEQAAQAQHQREQASQDAQAERDRARMVLLGQLPPAALISLSAPEQGALITEIQKLDAFRGMSPEQILAIAAANSPELARALGTKGEHERILAQKDQTLAEVKAAHSQGMAALERLAHTALLVQRDTTVAAVSSTPAAHLEPGPRSNPCPRCSEPCLQGQDYCKHCGTSLRKPPFGFNQ